MRQIWDVWSEQMPWFCSVACIEQSCGVSRNVVLSFHKTRIFLRCHALLDVLQSSTSLAPVLLKNIAAAAQLLNSKGQL
jgi:mRNA-degrading endonuclease toxin of MazEF toxin-antitoxin module